MASKTSSFYNDGTKLFRWNWGAFLDPIGFGYAHKAYKTYLFCLPNLIPCILAALWYAGILLPIVPLASLPLFLVWNIACGIAGERIAWSVGLHEDGVSFRSTMDSWNRAGWLHFILMCIGLITIAAIAVVVIITVGPQLATLLPVSGD